MNRTARKRQIDRLWSELDAACSIAYKALSDMPEESKTPEQRDIAGALNEFAFRGRLDSLQEREAQHERAHRSFMPGFDRCHDHAPSAKTASRGLIIEQAARGAKLDAMPLATSFIVWRDTAAESYLLGYMLRGHLSVGWMSESLALDYAEIVKGE